MYGLLGILGSHGSSGRQGSKSHDKNNRQVGMTSVALETRVLTYYLKAKIYPETENLGGHFNQVSFPTGSLGCRGRY